MSICLKLDWAFSGVCGMVPATSYGLGWGNRATIRDDLLVTLFGARW